MSLLRLENVTKRFGGLVAVDKVNLEVQEGELIAIVGPNGAGKTTLFNVVSGAFLPEEGKVFFEDQDITRLPAYKRAPLGLGRTFQIPRPFSSASVRENVAIGAMFGTLARALAMKPKLLLMDEAMAGMNPKDIDDMVQLLVRLKEEEPAMSIIAMVEHIMRAVAGLAERVMVMHQGAKLVDAPTKEALTDSRVVEVYLGKSEEE
jgi:branched-chain amino acid transport system ATP-binding protein